MGCGLRVESRRLLSPAAAAYCARVMRRPFYSDVHYASFGKTLWDRTFERLWVAGCGLSCLPGSGGLILA